MTKNVAVPVANIKDFLACGGISITDFVICSPEEITNLFENGIASLFNGRFTVQLVVIQHLIINENEGSIE